MSIEVRHLTHRYSEGSAFTTVALDDVSCTFEDGEFVGVIGHTGSGKSTLIQHLNGLLKPSSGQVLVDGEDLNGESEPDASGRKKKKKVDRRALRQRIGLVFQYPEYQLFEETVAKDIAFGPTNMGLDSEEIENRVYSSAEFVGLKRELLEKSPFDLSGGEKRRAEIAGVIAMDPDILILDEPCAGLDPVGRDILLSQIYHYHRERGNTVILVSHSMEDVASVCDRVMVMNRARLEMFDTSQNIFSRGEELREIGLRVPQITSIVDSLIDAGIPLNKGVLTVDKAVLDITEYLKKEGRL